MTPVANNTVRDFFPVGFWSPIGSCGDTKRIITNCLGNLLSTTSFIATGGWSSVTLHVYAARNVFEHSYSSHSDIY